MDTEDVHAALDYIADCLSASQCSEVLAQIKNSPPRRPMLSDADRIVLNVLSQLVLARRLEDIRQEAAF